MSKKKRKQSEPIEEPAPSPTYDYVPYVSPVSARTLLDADGGRWQLARGPLDPRRAKRLAVSAHAMSMSDGEYDEDRNHWYHPFLPEADRLPTWLEIKPLYGSDGMLSYEAYEFTDEDGRVLLYIQTYC
ncbi:hypothetical protein ACIA8O_02310 [Kitasatospora sp. NPDC051853]|uniref:hypothetical protein n=1 Tax=Kitasatospora sp. NPDC051853 TaxID=3364058 RepID=UPI0037B9DFA8